MGDAHEPERAMGRPKSQANMVDAPRITAEALAIVKSVCGYTGETPSAYISRVLIQQGRVDRDLEHARAKAREDGPGPTSTGPEPPGQAPTS